MKSIEISEKVLSQFPDAAMGYLVANNVVNESSEGLESLIKERLSKLSNLTSVEQSDGVLKWRNMFTRMSAKKGKLSSIESLLSMYMNDKKLPNINPVVNYYNSLSCILGLPMGAYTIDSLPNDSVVLREAKKNEEFVPIGGKMLEKTSNGEIVYSNESTIDSSESTIICRMWNNKDADISKITNESKNILFIFDAADEEQKEKIEEGLKILKEELPIYFNATIITSGILSKSNNKVVLD
jgi:DNA/RNA-binding domain of Phe-tRNA-synthetase-like protein